MQAKPDPAERVRAAIESIRSAAGDLSRFQLAVIVILVLLLAAGGVVMYARSRPRQLKTTGGGGEAQAAGNRSLSVHVAGAVVRPGLYQLAEGARVADALKAAGGATPDGSTDDVNLAARLKDGQKVIVPARVQGEAAPAGTVQAGTTTSTAVGGGSLVNINTADATQLDSLPGVGPALAQRIIDYRTRNGPFSSVEALDDVEGIGPRILESVRNLVTI